MLVGIERIGIQGVLHALLGVVDSPFDPPVRARSHRRLTAANVVTVRMISATSALLGRATLRLDPALQRLTHRGVSYYVVCAKVNRATQRRAAT